MRISGRFLSFEVQKLFGHFLCGGSRCTATATEAAATPVKIQFVVLRIGRKPIMNLFCPDVPTYWLLRFAFC